MGFDELASLYKETKETKYLWALVFSCLSIGVGFAGVAYFSLLAAYDRNGIMLTVVVASIFLAMSKFVLGQKLAGIPPLIISGIMGYICYLLSR